MTVRKRARTVIGSVAAIVLLGLILADTLSAAITLSLLDKALLVSIISAMLGVDIALDQAPLPITFRAQDDGGPDDE